MVLSRSMKHKKTDAVSVSVFYNYDKKESNLRTSFQEASQQGEADWENNPVDCSIMSRLFGPAPATIGTEPNF